MTRPDRAAVANRSFSSPALRSVRAALPAALLAALLAALPAGAAEPPGRVVAVHDGDTLTVLRGDRRIRVRLRDIDAPELGQPFGQNARRSLSELCFGKQAVLEPSGRDRYRRVLARVRCDGVDANREQVRRGLAWIFVRYADPDSPLYADEREAREARRGLWSAPDAIPPWDWRDATRRAARNRDTAVP